MSKKFNNFPIIQQVIVDLQNKAFLPYKWEKDDLGKKGEKIYVKKVR
jgi:hypothetical protein